MSTDSTPTTLKDSILVTAALIKKMMDEYDLSPEMAFEIYKWDVSTYLTYGQKPVATQEITNDGTGNSSGDTDVSGGDSPTDG